MATPLVPMSGGRALWRLLLMNDVCCHLSDRGVAHPYRYSGRDDRSYRNASPVGLRTGTGAGGLVVVAGFGIETLQFFSPTRHPTVDDAVIKAVAGIAGVLVGLLTARMCWLRLCPSSDGADPKRHLLVATTGRVSFSGADGIQIDL